MVPINNKSLKKIILKKYLTKGYGFDIITHALNEREAHSEP